MLLSCIAVQAQTSLPSSGAMSISQIATVMYNLGELTITERSGALSISFLNSKSHLVDKTAPFSISDWYGYTGSSGTGIDSISIYRAFNQSYDYTVARACSLPSGIYQTVKLYYTSGTLGVGTVLYRNKALTLTEYCGEKKIVGTDTYIIIHSSTGCAGATSPTGAGGVQGSIRLIGTCP